MLTFTSVFACLNQFIPSKAIKPPRSYDLQSVSGYEKNYIMEREQ